VAKCTKEKKRVPVEKSAKQGKLKVAKREKKTGGRKQDRMKRKMGDEPYHLGFAKRKHEKGTYKKRDKKPRPRRILTQCRKRTWVCAKGRTELGIGAVTEEGQ